MNNGITETKEYIAYLSKANDTGFLSFQYGQGETILILEDNMDNATKFRSIEDLVQALYEDIEQEYIDYDIKFYRILTTTTLKIEEESTTVEYKNLET